MVTRASQLFNVRNHALTESERTEILARNFKCEDLIVRESMRHCLELLVGLSDGLANTQENETMFTSRSAAPLTLMDDEDMAPVPKRNDDSLEPCESLRSLYPLIGMAKANNFVSFRE